MTLNIEALRKAHADLNKTGGGDNEGKYIILKKGTNVVRILPPKDPTDLFFVETRIHRVVDEEGNNRNFHCRKVHDEDCPLCDAYFALWKKHEASYDTIKESKDKDSMTPFKKAARSIKPGKRFYMNVIDRDEEDKDKNVKVLSVGIKVMDQILSDMTGDHGDITDLQEGKDFKVEKNMDGEWPDYSKSSSRPQATPAGTKQEIAALDEKMWDIKELVKFESLEDAIKIANIYNPTEAPVKETPKADTSQQEFEKKLES